MKLKKSAQILLATLALTGASVANAGIIQNSTFNEGLSDWDVTTVLGGTATVDSNTAYLTASSWIGQELSWQANDIINFDWAFWAGDYLPFNDYASFKLFDNSGSLLSETILSSVEIVGDYGQTGWQSFNHTFASYGTGWFNVGVYNIGDTILDSELGLDNFTMETVEVPEPASIALMLMGLLGVGVMRQNTKHNA